MDHINNSLLNLIKRQTFGHWSHLSASWMTLWLKIAISYHYEYINKQGRSEFKALFKFKYQFISKIKSIASGCTSSKTNNDKFMYNFRKALLYYTASQTLLFLLLIFTFHFCYKITYKIKQNTQQLHNSWSNTKILWVILFYSNLRNK